MAPGFSVFASRPADFDPVGPLYGMGERLQYKFLRRFFPGMPPRMGFTPAASDDQPAETRLTWTWNPSQVTSRGLRVSLPSLEVAAPELQGNGNELLMWSGFMYGAKFVCMPLIFGTGRYFRTSDSIRRLRLLDWRDAPGLEVRDIYLRLGQRNTGRQRGNARLPTTLATIVRVVLSSSSDTSIAIDDVRDKTHLHLRLRSSQAEHLEGTASRTEVWEANVDMPPDDERKVRVRILVSNPGPTWARDHQVRQIVDASLHFQGHRDGASGYPICTLHAGGSPPAKSGNRVQVVLKTGQTLTASIKGSLTPYQGLEGHLPRSHFTLRVAVTP